jgi:hypothetical protein
MKRIILERVLARITKVEETGCWIWTGGCDTRGYPKAQHQGKGFHVRRAVYRHFKKKGLDGREAVQTCGNRKCVNPDHIRVGPAGGWKYDSSHPEEKVLRAIELRAQGATWDQVEAEAGVSHSVLSAIRHGARRPHLQQRALEAEVACQKAREDSYQKRMLQALEQRSQGLTWKDACEGLVTPDAVRSRSRAEPYWRLRVKEANRLCRLARRRLTHEKLLRVLENRALGLDWQSACLDIMGTDVARRALGAARYRHRAKEAEKQHRLALQRLRYEQAS